jgi:hypothetical protein
MKTLPLTKAALIALILSFQSIPAIAGGFDSRNVADASQISHTGDSSSSHRGVSAYEPPPDISGPKRTGGSGGR